jgi:hypothetical protein
MSDYHFATDFSWDALALPQKRLPFVDREHDLESGDHMFALIFCPVWQSHSTQRVAASVVVVHAFSRYHKSLA